jgi:hypothetical protein
MSRDRHDIDDLFNSAYRQLEEEPSAGVWEKLSSNLNRKDAESYKKRLIVWKRATLVLSLALSVLILYETALIPKGNERSGKNAVSNTTSIRAKNKNGPGLPGHKNSLKNPVSKKNEKELATGYTRKPFHEDIRSIPETGFDPGNTTSPLLQRIAPSPLPFAREIERPQFSAAVADQADRLMIPMQYDHLLSSFLASLPQLKIKDREDELYLLLQLFDKVRAKKTGEINHYAKGWSVSAVASNDLVRYRLDNDDPQRDERMNIQQRETHEPSFSYFLLISHQFKGRLGFRTGMMFSKTAISINPQKIYAVQEPNGIYYKYITSSGYAFLKPLGLTPSVGDSLRSANAEHNLQYLSIPVLLNYKIDKRKFSYGLAAGLSADFLLHASVKTEVVNAANKEEVYINRLQGMRTFSFSLMANTILQYHVNNRLALEFSPGFKMALKPITKDNVVQTFPYSFGAGLGLNYKL